MKRTLNEKIEDLAFEMLFASIPVIIFIGILLVAGNVLGAPGNNVLPELERTDQMLMDLAESDPLSISALIADQYSLAMDIQDEAWQSYNDGQQILALHLTMQVRDIIRRIESLISESTHPDDAPSYKPLLRLLEQNAEWIENLAPAVDELGDELTRGNFATAVDLQNQAWKEFELEHYGSAGNFARIARDKLASVRNNIAAAERIYEPERVIAELERASVFLSRAEEKMPEENAEEAIAVLNTARDLYRDTEKLYSDGHTQEAMRLIEEVFYLAQRSVRLAENGGPDMAETLDILSKTDEYLDMVYGKISETDREDALEVYNRAVEMQNEARTAYEIGAKKQAEQLSAEARRVADLAVRTSQQNNEIRFFEVRNAIEHTNSLLEEYGPAIENSGFEVAIEMLARARSLQAQAHEFSDNGNYREALTTTRASAELLQRAINTTEE